jgi:hypothetical protein
MKAIYLIVDDADRIPITAASSIEEAEKLLNDYMGLGKDSSVEYLGFTKYDDREFYSPYEGYYKYKAIYFEVEEIFTFLRYYLVLNELSS